MFTQYKQYLKSKTVRVALAGLIIPLMDQFGPTWMSGFMSPQAYVVLAAAYPIVMTYLRSITSTSISEK